MPRSNRPRSRRGAGDEPEDDLSHLLAGWRRTEVRRGSLWNVQPVSAAQALKTYVCPGCNLEIAPGVAHVVAWRADGVMGDAADLAARRHWHAHCWKLT
ncbi:hypothetical protein [Cryobacterium tepidiphilum]|uniref:ATP/GTP-binding protein n=1 Tax=Cryobacterium tepidiphilum TaxID=2486026 RepID=A0A3M8L1H6_9MICO|nr:hypothetical protein [Cryobacterium tepidiphilum]RNE58474.1 hypothetical protein EEJ31_11975 [Cryobacterium tepidiphilum]